MRMRANRLVYVFIGVALAVGLLVSASVRPQPRLTASEVCYGACSSAPTPTASTPAAPAPVAVTGNLPVTG